jgi:hypothetical protein
MAYKGADSARVEKEGLPGVVHVVIAAAGLAGKGKTDARLESLEHAA